MGREEVDLRELSWLRPVETGDPPSGFFLAEITRSPEGGIFDRPVRALLPEHASRGDVAVYEYVWRSCSSGMPLLIPFVCENQSLLDLAKYYLRHASASLATFQEYAYAIRRYCEWAGRSPDQLVTECRDEDNLGDPRALQLHSKQLDDWVGCLQADGLAPSTVANYVAGARSLYERSGLKLPSISRLSKRGVCQDRAPRPEELQRLIDHADVRERAMVSCFALGGFREGTLSRLKYRHVKEDLERGVIPVHVHVEAEITKGKYHDYDTFLGQEAVEYLRAYLELRRQGTPRGYTPPEEIGDESPLFRKDHSKVVRPVKSRRIYRIIHNLYLKTGLIKPGGGRRYQLRPHSIRKYFRTQLAALGVDRDYIEYMMGHTVSTYHDIQMKGIEFLRNIYASSGLSIRPRTKFSKIEALKHIVRAWGMDPEQVLAKGALDEPHRVYDSPRDREDDQYRALSLALKEMMRKELLNSEKGETT